MPRKQYLTVTISKDEYGRKLVNVCPHCKKGLSEGYYYLELREDFVSKDRASLGAMGPDVPIAPVCCGVPVDYVQLHATMEEARDRRDRLDLRERRKLSHIKVVSPSILVPIV